MIAVRTAPSGPASSAMPTSFSGGGGDARCRRRRLCRRGRDDRRGCRAPGRRSRKLEKIAARGLRRRRGMQPIAQARDFGGELRAANLERRRGSGNSVDGRRPAGCRGRRQPGGECAAGEEKRRDSLDAHASRGIVARPLLAWEQTSRAVALRRRALCYYSSCTLHRLALRSIVSFRCKSSLSSPPDSPPHGFPASHSPTSMAVR